MEINKLAYDAAIEIDRRHYTNSAEELSIYEKNRWYGLISAKDEMGVPWAFFEIIAGVAWQWKLVRRENGCESTVNIRNMAIDTKENPKRENHVTNNNSQGENDGE